MSLFFLLLGCFLFAVKMPARVIPRSSPVVAASITLFLLSLPASAMAQHDPLLKIIGEKNLKDTAKSLEDGSYRGEAGILRIKPEVAKALGLKVIVDQNYLEARELYKKAESAFERAKGAMASKEAESFPGEHVKTIAENALVRKSSIELARKKLLTYRSTLDGSLDERLNDAASTELMGKLLTESLRDTDYQLRDALGHFYNLCRGTAESGPFLTSENVVFVNEVFHQFVYGTPQQGSRSLGLDRQEDFRGKAPNAPWKDASAARGFPFIQALEETLKKFKIQADEVDPLLFVALIKRESGFDPLAVSPSGAVGLTQIVPDTAAALGMKNVFNPPYLAEAASISTLEGKTKKQAFALLFQISQENMFEAAAQARDLMQNALALGKKKDALYSQYKGEILQKKIDDRLNPSAAIEYGFKFFLQQIKAHKGDISLALASYNAGPYRVKQHRGIPPFPETVNFRNKVIEIYRDYLRVLQIPEKSL
jgi:soluble lytic murein transglycosylase-like protein